MHKKGRIIMCTLKWVIIIFVSVEVGTFIDVNVLEKLDLNVWLSRGIGCLIAVVVALLLDYFLLKKRLTNNLKSWEFDNFPFERRMAMEKIYR